MMTFIAALKDVGAIAVIVLAGRFGLSPLYRLIASTGVREAMTASALLTVVVVVLLMEAVGLSAALGAFIAGVLLADSEYRHEIEANIAPFEGLLLGLFFVAVGMSLNLALLFAAPLEILAVVLGLIAVKAASLYVLGRRWRLSSRYARRLGLALSQGGEFAFVLATAAVGRGVVTQFAADFLAMAVTLSMIATPLLLLADEMLTAKPRVDAPSYDAMPKTDGHVIIAGFGRFGQIVGRILAARRIPFTALDNSPEQIDFVRRFGATLYYGDASRLDILEAAQADRARAFVVAVDDIDASLQTAGIVRRHYPGLPVFARARNRQHFHRLMDLGVKVIERETFLASLNLTRLLLRQLGLSEAEAKRTVSVFAENDTRRLVEDYAHSSDMERMRANAMRHAEELEELFAKDEAERQRGEASFKAAS
jgi:glutathione-regulated potassium-efflux system protein KefB